MRRKRLGYPDTTLIMTNLTCTETSRRDERKIEDSSMKTCTELYRIFDRHNTNTKRFWVSECDCETDTRF